MRNQVWSHLEAAELASALAIDKRNPFALRPMPASPKTKTDLNLHDFRFAPITQLIRIDIVNADLSGAFPASGNEVGISVSFARCANVNFTGAGLFSRIDGQFVSSHFNKVKARRAIIAAYFKNCSFIGSDLTGAAVQANFDNCVFQASKLNFRSCSVSFTDCTFADCVLPEWIPEFKEATLSSTPVSFSVVSGKVRIGKTISFVAPIAGWPPQGA